MSNVITLRHGSHGIIDAQQLGTSQAIMTYKSLIAQKLELPRTKITQIDSEFVEWLEADMEPNSPQKILQKLIELIRKYRTL